MEKKQIRIFIVDDIPKNIQSLGVVLSEASYLISYTSNPEQAIPMIKENDYDLILLDVMMPKIDGYTLCKRLKSDESTRNIPIIFLTAKTDHESIVNGFNLGAVDYISKPFKKEELLARINTHLDLQITKEAYRTNNILLENEILLRKQTEQQLRELNNKLIEQNQRVSKQKQQISEKNESLVFTQKKLIESEKMANLGALVAGVAHEINTPVGIAVTAITSLKNKNEEVLSDFNKKTLTKTQLGSYLDYLESTSQLIYSNLKRTGELITSFKQVSVDQTSEKRRLFRIKEYIFDIIRSVEPKWEKRKILFEVNCDENLQLNSYPGAFAQIFTNLIMNSLLHAFEENEEGRITISVISNDGNLSLNYADNGKGIPKENIDKIFDPFFTTNNVHGTGLGLNILFNIVTKQLLGTIKCTSEIGEGTQFFLTIPFEDNCRKR